jgi:diguanylate cyclase (GGDEF)-like protein
MDTELQTIWKDIPGPGRTTWRGAILVHIYPMGPAMGTRYVLHSTPLVIGRAETCDIRINDHSVSRRHAVIYPGENGCSVEDLGSLNGTFLNDVAVARTALKDGDYLRVGNCIYRFLMGGNVEAEYHEEIYRLTIIDALTETPNKRYLLEFLDRELSRSERYGRPLSVVMLDIDRFKSINDELGHLAGDYALRELAACIRAEVRKEELFARYGGEEFLIVLPETTRDTAVTFGERIRALVQGHRFCYDAGQFSITISLGVASTDGGEPQTAQELIRKADEALYQAKNDGRNCLRIWGKGASR